MSERPVPGQVWECNEARTDADDRPADSHDVDLWEDLPRFAAVVDDVQDGLVELTVTTGNSHPRTPDAGEKVDLAETRLMNADRWGLKRTEPSGDE